MAIRIPGPQPPLGLDRYFLDESPGWMPQATDTASGILGTASSTFAELAGGQVAPIAAGISDTGPIDSEQASLAGVGVGQASLAAANADRVNARRDDRLSGNFGAIDDQIGSAGNNLGNSPAGGGDASQLPPAAGQAGSPTGGPGGSF